MNEALERKTIADFGEQWTSFRGNPGYYGAIDLLNDLLAPLIPVESLAGLRVADVGSGTGRIANMLLDAGAKHVIAVEPSSAFLVLQENTAARRDRITYLHDTGDHLPAGSELDLVVSIGVLHHIPDPGPVARAAYEALRPGGQLFVWLYGREGNETYLRVAEPLRRLTTRLPHSALTAISSALALLLDVYIALCRFVPLPMRDYARGVLAKQPRSVRKLIIYDQLNPAYARYYRREEAERLLQSGGSDRRR
jgi:SAM-dependent methyltransferase